MLNGSVFAQLSVSLLTNDTGNGHWPKVNSPFELSYKKIVDIFEF